MGAAVAVVLAGCTGQPDPVPPPDDPAPGNIVEPSGLEPVTVAEEPLWRWDNGDAPVMITEVSFHGDVALVNGSEQVEEGWGLSIVDADSGAPLWSMRATEPLEGGDGASAMPLSGVAVSERHRILAVPYYSSRCVAEPCPPPGQQSPERGVAGLDLDTGEVQWFNPVIASVDEGADPDAARRFGDLTVGVYGGSGDAFMVVAGPLMNQGSPDEFRTLGLRPADGAEMWTADGVRGMGATDTTVVSAAGPPEGGRSLIALDLDTGSERWAIDEFSGALVDIGGDWLAVRHDTEYQVIDLTDGTSIHRADDVVGGAVLDAETGMLTYRTSENLDRLNTLMPAAQDGPLVSKSEVSQRATPLLSVGGYIVTHHPTDDTTLIVDRSGAELSDRLPGQPVVLTDDRLVLREGDGTGAVFAVYARTS
jgi:outer membrane protein assembly factor BamB